MKLAMIMNDNSYPGREYMKALVERKMQIDVIRIGCHSPINEMEELRCGGMWCPPLLEDICDHKCIYSFSSLKDRHLLFFLSQKRYDLGVQGGTGILKNNVIHAFRMGILNFHPGNLPEYRGCSAPEWQIWEGNPVVCTCHLVDELIDHGPIYKKKVLQLNFESYHKMRASVYPNIAAFMVEVLEELPEDIQQKCIEQDERNAIYRPYIGDENITVLANKMRKQDEYINLTNECPGGGDIPLR